MYSEGPKKAKGGTALGRGIGAALLAAAEAAIVGHAARADPTSSVEADGSSERAGGSSVEADGSSERADGSSVEAELFVVVGNERACEFYARCGWARGDIQLYRPQVPFFFFKLWLM